MSELGEGERRIPARIFASIGNNSTKMPIKKVDELACVDDISGKWSNVLDYISLTITYYIHVPRLFLHMTL